MTENVVREEASEYTMIHFACHGVYEPEAPLFSALLLSKGGDDDGRLEAHEIFSLKLNCERVALSACETGVSRSRGSDLVGLCRGFYRAGASSIVVSLWRVDDQATADLMEAFYGELGTGCDPAVALREAQLALLAWRPHPYYWAPFVLVGAWFAGSRRKEG